MSDTNQAVLSRNMARGLEFRNPERGGIVLYLRVAETKALISFAVTAKLICVFVFAYTKIRFSHDATHIMLDISIYYPLYDIRHFIFWYHRLKA